MVQTAVKDVVESGSVMLLDAKAQRYGVRVLLPAKCATARGRIYAKTLLERKVRFVCIPVVCLPPNSSVS